MKLRFRLTTVAMVLGLSSGCAPVTGVQHTQLQKISTKTPADVRLSRPSNGHVTIQGMRKFPYPYKSMLALSSDADHQTVRKFNMVHQFLNTTVLTPFGAGLGLDVADSFFLYNASNLNHLIDYNAVPIHQEMSYFHDTTTTQYAADMIDVYIKAGWIDTLHSYGDFSMRPETITLFRRGLAMNGLQALQRHGDFIRVWTDHGNKSNVDNFGSYGINRFYNYQQGANPSSPYYHIDKLIPYGVRFVWADQQSEIFGRASVIYPLRLPDGRSVWGFTRYTSVEDARGKHHRKGSEWLWTVDDLARQLTPHNLSSIERNHQYAVVAQHLSADNSLIPLPENGVAALRLLAREYRNGRVLVTRTSRLLQYNVSQNYIRYDVSHEGGRAVIHLRSIDDPVFGSHTISLSDIRGMTFYSSNPHKTEIRIGNQPLSQSLLQYNPTDGVAPSITVKWYPPDVRDYTRVAPNPVNAVPAVTSKM